MRKRIFPLLGAIQVQYTNSMMYVSMVSVTMMALTFWATAGTSLFARIFPWMGAREFLGVVAFGLMCLMIFDRKIMFNHRLSYINEQSYAADKNPAVDDLKKILADVNTLKGDIEKIKKALGIEGDE